MTTTGDHPQNIRASPRSAGSIFRYANNLAQPSQSALYHYAGAAAGDLNNSYDGLNRLVQFQRGFLISTASNGMLNGTASGAGAYESWTLDSQGNWTRFNENGTVYNTQYTKDYANTSTSAGGNIEHEVNTPTGNAPASTDVLSRNATYDAWNRLVTSSYTMANHAFGSATYSYDAQGREIVENDTSALHLYYSTSGKLIEEAWLVNNNMTPTTEIVSSPVDGRIILAENDLSQTQFYAITDPSGSVTAIVGKTPGQTNSTWHVLERYQYMPYGQFNILNPNWTSQGTNISSMGWQFFYNGMRYDVGDGLYHTGGSAYDSFLGRTMQPNNAAAGMGGNPYTVGAGSTGGIGYTDDQLNSSGFYNGLVALPGATWDTVSGMGKEIGYRAADFANDILYLQSFGALGSSNQNLSQLSQLQATGQTTWARATFSSVPIVGSGFNVVTGTDLLTGRQLNNWEWAGAWSSLGADLSFAGAWGAGKVPALASLEISSANALRLMDTGISWMQGISESLDPINLFLRTVVQRGRGASGASFGYGTFGWRELPGYPEFLPRPSPLLRLIEGEEYDIALAAKKAANDAIRRADPAFYDGMEIHEITPVKFGGSPTDPLNKIAVPATLHRQVVTPWWNAYQRSIGE
jgi:hypothetical protein